MGVHVNFELDEALNEQVQALAGSEGGYADIGDYLRDLIQADLDNRRWEFEACKAELQRAFATPIEDYVMVSAEDVIARGRARRRQG